MMFLDFDYFTESRMSWRVVEPYGLEIALFLMQLEKLMAAITDFYLSACPRRVSLSCYPLGHSIPGQLTNFKERHVN